MYQEMQFQGQWLFRWRSYLPLLFLVVCVPAFGVYSYPFGSHAADLVWEIICLCIGLSGLAIRCTVIGYAPQNTSGHNSRRQVADILNTKGMYSLVRNPLYLGNFLMWMAPILVLHTWWLWVIFVLAFFLYYERIIITEEAFLNEKFGDDYIRWSGQTPAFFPVHLHWQKPDLSFSWKHALRREYQGLFGLIAAITAVEFIGDLCIHRSIVVDPVWAVIFVIGVTFYLLVRFLVKYTPVLHVDGR